MSVENFDGNQAPKQETEWSSLEGQDFDLTKAEEKIREVQNGGEVSQERQELENTTVDKIKNNPKAKLAFKKIILGALLATTVAGSIAGTARNFNNHTTVEQQSLENYDETQDSLQDQLDNLGTGYEADYSIAPKEDIGTGAEAEFLDGEDGFTPLGLTPDMPENTVDANDISETDARYELPSDR